MNFAKHESSQPSPIKPEPVVDRSWYYFFVHQVGGRLLLATLGVIVIVAAVLLFSR